MRPRRALLLVVLSLPIVWIVSATARGSHESWLRVEPRDLVLGVPTEGELEAIESALIGPPQVERIWNFQISMLAPEGSRVAEGDVVVRFDTTELQQRLLQTSAEAESAEKEHEKAATDLEVERRQLELELEEAEARLRKAELQAGVSEEVTARQELAKARIDRELAVLEAERLESRLEQHAVKRRTELAVLASKAAFARRKVDQLQTAIDQMAVEAPRAGTVVYRSGRRGEKHQVGDQVWRAAKVVEIPDLERMRAAAEVGEASAGRLVEGLPVTFRLDTYPDREYRGTVASIRRAVQRKSRENPVKIVQLTLDIEETDTERMRPGMRFRGTIVTDSVAQVLTMPGAAVFSDARGPYVWVKTAFGQRKVYPTLGRRNDELVEVLAGLESGDRVLQRLSDGGPLS